MGKKLTITILIIVFIAAFTNTAIASSETTLAEERSSEDHGVRFTYISSTATLLNINSIGKAYCDAQIECYSNVDKVRISGYLERYSNGTWTTLKHWTEDTRGDYGVMHKQWHVTSGYRYRWRVYYYAYAGSNYESTSSTMYDLY